MKVAVMQPYFFPYLGYWQLYFNVDIWVILDEVQFRQFSWMRRNRLLNYSRTDSCQYISVPVEAHSRKTPINMIKLNHEVLWQDEIMLQLARYRDYGSSQYPEVEEIVKKIIYTNDSSLLNMLTAILAEISKYLGMQTRHILSSTIEFDRNRVTSADEWSLLITEALQGDHYFNLPGGIDLYSREKFLGRGVNISFLAPDLKAYPQAPNHAFIPGLSIIDVLMFNPVEEVCRMIKQDFKLV